MTKKTKNWLSDAVLLKVLVALRWAANRYDSNRSRGMKFVEIKFTGFHPITGACAAVEVRGRTDWEKDLRLAIEGLLKLGLLDRVDLRADRVSSTPIYRYKLTPAGLEATSIGKAEMTDSEIAAIAEALTFQKKDLEDRALRLESDARIARERVNPIAAIV